MFSQSRIVKGNDFIKEPLAPSPEKLRLLRAYFKVKISVFKKVTALISTSSFLILKTHFYWQKNHIEKFGIPIIHVIFCWYKNRHDCRQNRIWMHVILLQILQSSCIFLPFYYKIDEQINVLRAEFKFLEVYTSLQNTCLFPYPYVVTVCELSLSAVKYSVCL